MVKIIKYTLLSLALLVIVMLVIVNLPFVQPIITGKTNKYLSRNDIPVRIDEIAVKLNGRAGLSGIHVYDDNQDMIISIEHLNASVSIFPLLKKKLVVNNISVAGGNVKLVIDPLTGEPEIVLLFSKAIPGKKQQVQKPGGSTWDIRLRKVSLKDISFIYSDTAKGILMQQSLAGLNIRFDNFIPEIKEFDIADLKIEDAKGIITAGHLSHEDKLRYEISIGAANINYAGISQAEQRIAVSRFQINNGSFSILSPNGKISEDAIMHSEAINMIMKDAMISGDRMGLTVDQISFIMDNGFALKNGNIHLHPDSNGNNILNARLESVKSKLNLRLANEGSIDRIINSWRTMPFDVVINDSEISTGEMLAFFPGKYEDTTFRSQIPSILKLDCSARGNTERIEISHLNLGAPGDSDPFGIGPLNLRGRIESVLSDPLFDVYLDSRAGSVNCIGSFHTGEERYDIDLVYTGLDIGRITALYKPGPADGSLRVQGTGFDPQKMQIIARVQLDSFRYDGNTYNDILTTLDGNDGDYSYSILSNDRMIQCNLAGLANLHDTLNSISVDGDFKIDAPLRDTAGFYGMKHTAGKVEAQLSQNNEGFSFNADLKDLSLDDDFTSESISNLSIRFNSSDTSFSGEVRSDFLNGEFESGSSVDELRRSLEEYKPERISYVDSISRNRVPVVSLLPEMSLSVDMMYHPVLKTFIRDTLIIFNNLKLRMDKDMHEHFFADLSIDELSFKDNSGTGNKVHLEILPEKSSLLIESDIIQYNNIPVNNPRVSFFTSNDTSRINIRAKNQSDSPDYDISATAFRKDSTIRFVSNREDWIINSSKWSVSPGEFLILLPGEKDFIADLHLDSDSSAVEIEGQLSEKISMICRDLNLRLPEIPGMGTYDYSGKLDGRIDYMYNKRHELGAIMDIKDLAMKGYEIGRVSLSGNVQADSTGITGSRLEAILNDTANVSLNIQPGKKGIPGEIHASFSSIPLIAFEPMVKDFVSELNGNISGRFDSRIIEDEKPEIYGHIGFDGGKMSIIPLNTTFHLTKDSLVFKDNRLLFNNFTVMDSLMKPLRINGFISLGDREKIMTNLEVSSDNLLVMNTTEKDNPLFNGSIYVNSVLEINGPVNQPSIEGYIKLAKGTIINYRFTEDLAVSEVEDIITFVGSDEEYILENDSLLRSETLMGIPGIETSIEIDPNSLFTFSISSGFDIGARITGGGFLNYTLSPNRVMNLRGTYRIDKGSSQLRIPGWPNKEFIITPGSTLAWDGRIDDPELNIETTSNVKGSYFNPVDQRTREADFQVYMKLQNRLSRLDVIFDVGSQDQYITSVINSLSDDERMRQAINLLVFGSIQLPNMTNTTDVVTQQINQFWESQLNQFSGSIFKNMDVSFGINTFSSVSDGGAKKEYTSFTYEFRRDLFKERASLMVSGRMSDFEEAGEQQNVFDNFVFEYMLDTTRTKFLKIYRQQNYEDILEGEVIRSGIGFIYRKTFDNPGDIWRREEKPEKRNRENK